MHRLKLLNHPQLSRIFQTLILFLTITLFFTFPVSDADFGWHLKYGEYFLKTGDILKANQFSWALPDFEWVNHSWLFDVVIAFLFNQKNWALVSFVSGIIVALSLFISYSFRLSLSKLISVLIFCLLGSELLNNGLRSQTFSLLFTAILWKLLNSNQPPLFIRLFAYTLLFIAWANIHGQFIYGLGIMILFFIGKYISHYHQENFSKLNVLKTYLSFLIVSLASTLLTPWGTALYQTVLGHLNNPNLTTIYEWMPWEFNRPLTWLFLATAMISISQLLKTKPKPFELILPIFVTAIMAISTRRMIPYFLILSISSLSEFFSLFIKNIFTRLRLNHPNPTNLNLHLSIFLLLVSGYLFISRNIFNQSWDSYCNSHILCSEASIKFIKDNHLTGKFFNSYRIGGYMIYRIPEIKPFVDGRMTLWEQNHQNPYHDFNLISQAKAGSRELFYQYNPDYVIIHPQYPVTKVLIQNEGFKIIYSDEKILILENPHRTTN